MSAALTGFLTGMIGGLGENVKNRKDEAREYFNKQMELASRYALKTNEETKAKMAQSRELINKLKGQGVPSDVIKGIANQNPEDLSMFYDTIADMQVRGVKMNEDVYRNLLKVSNEQGEPTASFVGKMKDPLITNAKADPEAFDADPEGSIWATMLGHNAMAKANKQLENTMLGDFSAAELIRNAGSPDEYDAGAAFNFELAGNLDREAEERLREPKEKSPNYYADIASKFIEFQNEELGKARDQIVLGGGDPYAPGAMDRAKAEAQAKAVETMTSWYPEGDVLAAIRPFLSGQTEEAPAPSEAVGDVPRPASKADYDALPSGTVFIDPKGQRRKKP